MNNDLDETLKQKIHMLEKHNEFLENKLGQYERGEENLYRSLQRKMNEISKFLNANSLDKIDVEDKSKSFERIFLVLQKCETLATSVKTFGEICGAVKDAKEDKKPFNDTLAIDRR